MKKTNTARSQYQYGNDTLVEKISWFFTHFLFVSNKKVFKYEYDM
jgi:hypothetical protein